MFAHCSGTIVRETEEIWLNVTSDAFSYDAACTATGMLTDEVSDDWSMTQQQHAV